MQQQAVQTHRCLCQNLTELLILVHLIILTCAVAAPFVVLGYIATAGTHIVSFPAILIAPVASAASTAFVACPVPLGAIVISPSRRIRYSVIVPEFVPLFVLKTKSAAPPVVTVSVPAPFDVKVAAAPESPNFYCVTSQKPTSPVPFGVTLISMFESSPAR